ncbi:MAG: carbon-nitrogen hydrolase family protein [Firmicutes bacterium]|nr:carbon-nitrogen hydrolase family protein [Bacillota bacterium]
MRIGVAQTFVAEEMKTNTARMMEKIAAAADMEIDLLLFPEMCLTGYNFHAWKNAHFWGELDESLQKLALQASATGMGLVVGRVFLAGDKMYNAATVFLPDGKSYTYCKNNLTAAEEDHLLPGTAPLSFDFRGYRFGVIICRDQNYPELARKTCKGADALLLPAAHYYKPAEARWKLDKNRALPLARAVENRCHVFLANTVGSHLNLISLGNSLIADPEGILVAMADEVSETFITCDLPAAEAGEAGK